MAGSSEALALPDGCRRAAGMVGRITPDLALITMFWPSALQAAADRAERRALRRFPR